MARYRIDRLAELARQMEFTPAAARATQLQSAETLLDSVDPMRAYPIEYLTFRITGYHPPSAEQTLLAGLAIQHDLGLLIESVSETLHLRADQSAEPVLQICDVCERFAVTSKTVQRWRRRGLTARRFTFADGKRRVGFLLGSVERFLQRTRGETGTPAVVRKTNGDRLRSMATRLANSGACTDDITRRVARRTGKTPLAVLHALRQHDREDAGTAILTRTRASFGEEEILRITRAFRRGESLAAIARQVGLTRSAVYGVLLRQRVDHLLRRKTRFIDDTLYHQPDAENVIEQLVAQTPIVGDFDRERTRVPRDLPAYLAELYRTPLLGAAKERALFLKLNFRKWQFASARRRFEPDAAKWRDVERLDSIVRKIAEVKNAIVRANLRLVVSVARKHTAAGAPLMDLVSDGNVVLLRSVDGFDVHRGYRFSTYASLALMKGFARSVPAARSTRTAGVKTRDGRSLEEVADRRENPRDRIADRDHLRSLLAVLEPHEREVLLAHYGIAADPITRRSNATNVRSAHHRAALAKVRAAIADSSAA